MAASSSAVSSSESTPCFDFQAFLKTLPHLPGVYRMLDAAGQVLYVGKAVNLKKRVSSYFQKNDHSPRIRLMIRQIAAIEITTTRSEAEALILENNLIKALSPRYNILFRDDKSYPYLKFSGHEFPQITYYRGSLKKPHQYFGPFTNAYAVKESIEIIQKIFRLRTCEDSVMSNRTRPCLLYQIRRCSAPCTGAIDAAAYAESVAAAVDFLEGRTSELARQLSDKMQQAAEHLDFETAARLRDQLQALAAVQSQQFVETASESAKAVDVLALAAEGGVACVNWVSIRNGRHVGDRSFFPQSPTWEEGDSASVGEAFVAQHYLGQPKPDLILSNFDLSDALKTALQSEHGRKLQFVRNTVGERKVWLTMAEQNAKLAIAQKLGQQQHQTMRLAALAELLRLPKVSRLECFDISHTQGEATVASCVVYADGAMQPSQYRRFNIKTTACGDDYTAMREALSRRYRNLAAHRNRHPESSDDIPAPSVPAVPDVVIIDGGKGQIGVALEVWRELGLTIPLIGVAKGPERKAGAEDLILPQFNETLHLGAHHPALHLLQTVRDEAHRFAITGHRARRAKARAHSALEDIPGIGSKRKKSLLQRFGGMRGVLAAGVDDLAQVEGISHALAEKIYDYLHS